MRASDAREVTEDGDLDWIRALFRRLDHSAGLGLAAAGGADVSCATTAPVGASEGLERPRERDSERKTPVSPTRQAAAGKEDCNGEQSC